jgi:hypothetical protein
MPCSMPCRMTTWLIGPNLLVSYSPFLLLPMILPRPAGVINPPPSESGRFFRFSILTSRGFTIPEPVAPRPEPLVQPYLESSRSAKPCCPGRRDRGADSSGSPSSAGCSWANTASSSVSVAGMSSGGGGRAYRTGAREIVAELGWMASRGREGGGGGMTCPDGGFSAFWKWRIYASSPVGSSGFGVLSPVRAAGDGSSPNAARRANASSPDGSLGIEAGGGTSLRFGGGAKLLGGANCPVVSF